MNFAALITALPLVNGVWSFAAFLVLVAAFIWLHRWANSDEPGLGRKDQLGGRWKAKALSGRARVRERPAPDADKSATTAKRPPSLPKPG